MATTVLTAAELNTISAKLLLIEQAITNYLNSAASAGLTPGQRTALAVQRDKIGDDVGDITSLAAGVAISGAGGAVASLNGISTQIKTDIIRMATVQKVINLAGAVLGFTAAILTTPLDPGAIAAAIPGVVSAAGALIKPAAGT